MIHREVYNTYKTLMPFYADRTVMWFPNGRNSVRVRQEDNKEFIFTYNSKNDWLFETVDHFLERMKGERKM